MRPQRDDPLADIYARDRAVHDFETYLKIVQHCKPTSVNFALAALDHFYRFLGSGRPDMRRELLPRFLRIDSVIPRFQACAHDRRS
jgi:integrase/recombinase XerC